MANETETKTRTRSNVPSIATRAKYAAKEVYLTVMEKDAEFRSHFDSGLISELEAIAAETKDRKLSLADKLKQLKTQLKALRDGQGDLYENAVSKHGVVFNTETQSLEYPQSWHDANDKFSADIIEKEAEITKTQAAIKRKKDAEKAKAAESAS